MVYEAEETLPDGSTKPVPDKVEVNDKLLDHYRKLIGLRNELPALRTGSFETVLIEDEKQLYGFKRVLDGQEIIVVLNNSDAEQATSVAGAGNWTDKLSGSEVLSGEGGKLQVTLPAKSAAILVRS
jgi:glycosidase